MKAIALYVFAVLGLFVSFAGACAISPASTSGSTSQPITFTIVDYALGVTFSYNCGDGWKSASSPSFTCSFSSAQTYAVQARTTDSSDNVYLCSSATVTVSASSDAPPSVLINAPSSATAGQTITITGTASDAKDVPNPGQVREVSLRILVTGSTADCGSGLATSTNSFNTWSYSWTVPSGVPGCTITATATDDGGFSADSRTTTLTIVAPTPAPTTGPACTLGCSNKLLRTSCDQYPVSVECCSAADCAQCDGQKFLNPSCSNSTNKCVNAPSFVAGKCDFNPSCTVVASGLSKPGSAPVTVTYSGFASVPSFSVDCGNGKSVGASCSSASSSCSASCSYSAAGSFPVSAVASGVSCQGTTVSVGEVQATATPTPSVKPTATASATPQPTAGAYCKISPEASSVNAPGSIGVVVTYGGIAQVESIQISCGNGKLATAKQCLTGACKANCSYSSIKDCAGTKNCKLSSSFAGVSCESAISISGSALPSATPDSFGGLFGGFKPTEANVSVVNLVTAPAVVIENQPLQLSAILASESPLEVESCSAEGNTSACACSLSGSDPLNPILDCKVSPPVSGKYLISLLATDSGRKKVLSVVLNPGEKAFVERSPMDWVYTAFNSLLVVLVAGLIIFAALAVRERLPKDQKKGLLARKKEIEERMVAIEEEFNTNKMLFMKGRKTVEQYKAFDQERLSEKTKLISDLKQLNEKLEKLGVKLQK